MKEALRDRQSGVDLKPPQAAVVKNDGGERCGKVGTRFRQARLREASASEPLMTCRKRIRTGGLPFLRDQFGGCPETAQAASGMEAARSSIWLFVRNVRTWPAMPREKAQAAPTARPKVPMRRRGADCAVVVLKRGNARGAKGVGHRR